MYRKTPPIKTEVIIEGSTHIQKKKKQWRPLILESIREYITQYWNK